MKPELHTDTVLARRLRKEAESFARQPKLLEILQRSSEDPKRHAAALSDPKEFLIGNGLTVPDGLAFDLFEHPPRFLPFPDWTPFVIEFTNCRTIWVLECDDSPTPTGNQRKCSWREEQFCLGFRIYPQPWPRGPFTL